MSKDKPKYQIGVQETRYGWIPCVLFEEYKTQEDARKFVEQLAPIIAEALGGWQAKIQ